MIPYILIEPIQFGELQEKKANCISWTVTNLIRGAETAYANCYLIWEDGIGSTKQYDSFVVEIDHATLQAWGSDDSVIDDVVLAYSPLFVRRNP